MSVCGICFPYPGVPESAIGCVQRIYGKNVTFISKHIELLKDAVWPVGHIMMVGFVCLYGILDVL